MKHPLIQKPTLKFLTDLSANNNREWFTKNKERYTDAQENMIVFVDALIAEMNKHDVLEESSAKASLYRIYRDVRFSKDKTPYNPRFAAGFQRATKLRRGGYYLNIKPGNSFLGCGFWGPNTADLKRIREDITLNHEDWTKLLKSKNIKTNFGELTGETLATAPRGFEKDHPAINLLRQKQFIFRHEFSDKEVLSENFLKEVNTVFKAVRPWFDYMSDVLTTNANGESIV